MIDKNEKIKALRAAFPLHAAHLCGLHLLGMAYGIYMNSLGFSFIYPMLMSLVIYAGSMEFLAASLLVGAFDPLRAFLLTLMVNARHLFYGISMLEKYKNVGAKKFYLIFGMCDESFSINCTTPAPLGVDPGWFMFFVTLLNQCYWVLGATLGGLLGSFITFDTTGLDFVMTALFVVIFLDQWLSTKDHVPALVGVGASVIALLFFHADGFIIPAMLLILLTLTALRKPLEQAEENALKEETLS